MKGFHTDIESDTTGNKFFRKVLFTGPHAQLVLMALNPGEDIGAEVHEHLDQFIRIDEGSGTGMIGEETFELKDGSAMVVPAGEKHNVTAGPKGLKLYAVYTSKNHPDHVVDKTKKDAMHREGDMNKSLENLKLSGIPLVVIPGELSKAQNMAKVSLKTASAEVSGSAGHPAGTSKASAKIKSPIPGTGHEERMKLTKMAAARWGAPKPGGTKDDTTSVDKKGRVKGGKSPYPGFGVSVSGMASQSSDLYGKGAVIMKPSELGASAPEKVSGKGVKTI